MVADLVSDAGAENVRRYAERGGTALITFFSGIVDPTDRVRLGGYPAPWRDLLIDLHGAAPLLTFSDGHLAGEAAATRHAHGQGEATCPAAWRRCSAAGIFL
jgi:beta-galactosidase